MRLPTPYFLSKAAARKSALILLTLSLVVILIQLMSLADTVLAASAEVTVAVIPSSVELPAQGQVEVQVVVTNSSTNTVQNVHLSWFNDRGVKVALGKPASLPTLAPTGQFTWVVQLEQQPDNGPLTNSIQFRVDYTRPVQGQPGTMQGVAFAALSVQSVKLQAVEQVADIQVVTSLSSLNEQQPGDVYLLITNKTNFPIEITQINPQEPDFIKLVPNFQIFDKNIFDKTGILQPRQKLTVDPLQVISVALHVMASGPVQPGAQLMVFQVTFKWGDAGQMTGSLVATQQVNVGILGVSDILSLLGIPSFLVLPGFLMLVTIRLMRRLVRHTAKPESDDSPPLQAAKADGGNSSPLQVPKADDDESPLLQASRPEFWLIAITLSGGAALLYPLIMWHFGFSRNYLLRYDLSDVIIVWLGSIGLAIVSYLLIMVIGIWLYKQIIRLYHWYMTPSAKDEPITILRKLERHHLSILRPYITVKVGQVERHALLLEEYDEKKEFWLSTEIVIKWKDGHDPSLENEVQKYLTRGNDGRLPNKNAGRLAGLLKQKNHIALELEWASRDPLRGPFKAKREQLELPAGNDQLLVEKGEG